MTTFKQDTENHVMTIENDNGLHRCIHFGKPGTNCYSFRLVTWPGHLAISGDMGDYTFARIPDMFGLFRDGACKSYLTEKLVATSKQNSHQQFCWDHFKTALMAEVETDQERKQIESKLRYCEEDEHGAVELARNWPDDAPHIEWSDMGYAFRGKPTYHFLWCLEAIMWGVAQYDAYLASREAPYQDVEVEGCVRLGGDIMRARECGQAPEFWTVYLRDKDGFAEAVCNTRTDERAEMLAQALKKGLNAMNML